MLKRILAGSFCALFGLCAFAGGLSAPFGLDSAAVMPKGIRSVRVATINTAVESRYGDAGTIEPLAAKFNRSLSYGRLADSTKAGPDRVALKGYMISQAGSLDTTAAYSFGEVNSHMNVFVPVMAYGVTDTLTIGLAAPVIHSELNVSTGWQPTAQLQGMINTMVAEGRRQKVAQYQSMLNNAVVTEFETKGYETPEDHKKTQIGDLTLVAKQKVYDGLKMAAAVQGRVVLPTGRRSNVNDLFDFAGGDGQWDVGAGFVVDYFVMPKLTLTSSTSYVAQLPAHVAMRIPTSSDETLTPDVDNNTRMNLGDVYSQALAAKYSLFEGVTTGLGTSLQYKAADSYRGGMYSGERYGWLSNETEQMMMTASLSITGSTIPAFKKGEFAIPLEVGLTGTRVFTGRNVPSNTLAALELVAFF